MWPGLLLFHIQYRTILSYAMKVLKYIAFFYSNTILVLYVSFDFIIINTKKKEQNRTNFACMILSRGGTRMAGFLTACVDASKVIVPMLDTIIQCKIREEETAYLASVVGRWCFLCVCLCEFHGLINVLSRSSVLNMNQ